MATITLYMNNNIEYISKIKKGEETSFRHFVNSYSKDLFYYAQCFVRSKETAEEVVSDVFLDVWRHREEIDEIKNIKAWLLTLTHNKAISYLRKAENSSEIASWEEIDDFQIIGNLQTPDEEMISKEEIAQINSLIQTLPPKCKVVFALAKIERLPYKEIADMLNISVKTINVHVAKALEIISNGLKK